MGEMRYLNSDSKSYWSWSKKTSSELLRVLSNRPS
jgi:hypothetical protein